MSQQQKPLMAILADSILSGEGKRTPFTHPYNYDPFVTWRAAGEPTGTVYTDRMFQWDSEKHDKFCIKHFGNRTHYWDSREPKKIEAFLRDYLGRPNLKLLMIEQHCNQATGFPLWRFDYSDQPTLSTNQIPGDYNAL